MGDGSLDAFVLETAYADLPPETIEQAKRCLIDLIGVAAAGSTTELSRIIGNHAVRHFAAGSGGARLMFDGRLVSPAGAALANGMTIDAYDAHDGHPLTKGHVGCGVLPALLAFCQAETILDPREFLASLVIGYEIGTRAGIALHQTALDYHTSGAWVALACAALGCRLMKLDAARLHEALGTAEYHGPRSQMMRCIDHPTMVKDGSGWGAMAGVSAAYLAADGFTGAPAVTVTDPAVAAIWSDLGRRWRIVEQYFKPYPVCRWAQPAMEAAMALARDAHIAPDEIESVEVFSFQEAIRLAARAPATTEQAQYSLPFPVAAALVHRRIGAKEISAASLRHPDVLRLSQGMTLSRDAEYDALFPAERWARIVLILKDGRRLASPPAVARGSAENPLTGEEISEKFHAQCAPVLGTERSAALASLVDGLPDTDLRALIDLIHAPVNRNTTE
jgi:2-methylcitrate dehydratase PrpD